MSTDAPSWPRRLAALAALPAVMTLAVPALILRQWPPTDWGQSPVWRSLGALVLAGAGFTLAASTIHLFHRQGQGTLAPWDPTRRLVVEGPYRFVRNPMISGVLFVLLGEAAWAASWPLLAWSAAFWALNAVYIPLSEEPGLHRRFGADYDRYAEAVPRWIPRLRPWSAP